MRQKKASFGLVGVIAVASSVAFGTQPEGPQSDDLSQWRLVQRGVASDPAARAAWAKAGVELVWKAQVGVVPSDRVRADEVREFARVVASECYATGEFRDAERLFKDLASDPDAHPSVRAHALRHLGQIAEKGWIPQVAEPHYRALLDLIDAHPQADVTGIMRTQATLRLAGFAREDGRHAEALALRGEVAHRMQGMLDAGSRLHVGVECGRDADALGERDAARQWFDYGLPATRESAHLAQLRPALLIERARLEGEDASSDEAIDALAALGIEGELRGTAMGASSAFAAAQELARQDRFADAAEVAFAGLRLWKDGSAYESSDRETVSHYANLLLQASAWYREAGLPAESRALLEEVSDLALDVPERGWARDRLAAQ